MDVDWGRGGGGEGNHMHRAPFSDIELVHGRALCLECRVMGLSPTRGSSLLLGENDCLGCSSFFPSHLSLHCTITCMYILYMYMYMCICQCMLKALYYVTLIAHHTVHAHVHVHVYKREFARAKNSAVQKTGKQHKNTNRRANYSERGVHGA